MRVTHSERSGRVTIGENSVIGAHSIVTRDVPPYSVVAGNPAKVIRKLESKIQESIIQKRAWIEDK